MARYILAAAASIAAIAVAAAPAAAQPMPGHSPVAGAAGQAGDGPRIHRGRGGDSGRHRGDRHRRGREVVVVSGSPWFNNEGWALYNNRNWQPESFNDWWHERPSRAYPRWLQNNQNCDRMWWGGGVWRCSW
jgi:hypothetical protein